jgi:hypothetical protein
LNACNYSSAPMKTSRNTLFIFLIILFSTACAYSQDIPNASFENWANGEPVDWHTTNQSLFTTVIKDATNPQNGVYSAQLKVVTVTIPFIGTYSMPGILSTANMEADIIKLQFNIWGGYPFTGMPNRLAGYLRYQPVNNDTCYFGWALSKWQNGARDTIGYGVTHRGGTISDWTYFEVPIEYNIWEAPDTMNILFLNTNLADGQTHTNTKMWVDNLSFIYGPVGIEGITFPNDLRIYANGETRRLILESSFDKPENLDIWLYSVNGALMLEDRKIMSQSTETISIASLKPGIYIIKVTNGNRLIESRKISIAY